MNACRIDSLIGKLSQFSLRRLVPYSTASAPNPRFPRFFSDDKEEGGSAVYRHVLKYQRPTTERWRPQLENSVSFIGSVDRALQTIKTKRFGVYTSLRVKNPRDSSRTFKILLKMWDEVADMCMQHLKPKDFIYVSGHLGSYTKADENGNLRLFYEVTVKELNYVAECAEAQICRKFVQSQTGGGEAGMGKYENQLYLWQVFFTNPYEWWDKRKRKVNSRQPDFVHKDTREALWLNPDDPPWVKRQLHLLDSRMAEQSLGEFNGNRPRVSLWVYDDQ